MVTKYSASERVLSEGESQSGPRRRSGNRRDALYEAALSLFVNKGYHCTTTDDICRKAHLSAGALYTHFASKEDLARQIFVDLNEELAQGVEERLANVSDPRERIRLITSHLFEWCEKNQEGAIFALLVRHSEIFSKDVPVPCARTNLRRFFEETIELALERGEIPPGDLRVHMKMTGILLVFVRDRLEGWDKRNLSEYVDIAARMCCQALGMEFDGARLGTGLAEETSGRA